MSWPLRIATLKKGVGVPALPAGYTFVVDSAGAYVRLDDGSYVITEA